MSNLNSLRNKISQALKNKDVTITLGVEEAKLYVRDAEAMHGGSFVVEALQGENDKLKARIKELEKQLIQKEPEDKVAALLPGGEE